jgi:hypothetical protein
MAGSARRGQAAEQRFEREPDAEQAPVAARGPVQLEPHRQAGRGAPDRHREAGDARVAARIGILDERGKGRHVRPVQLRGLVVAHRRGGQRGGGEHERGEAVGPEGLGVQAPQRRPRGDRVAVDLLRDRVLRAGHDRAREEALHVRARDAVGEPLEVERNPVPLEVAGQVRVGLVEGDREADLAVELGEPGQVHVHHDRAGAPQPIQRGGGEPLGLRVEVLPEHRAGDAHPQPAQRGRRHLVAGAGDDGVEQHQVGDLARHRPRGVARVGDRRDALLRVAPERRPQAADAVERGRDAHRASGVGAEPGRGHPRGDGVAGAARGAPRDARGIVGVAGGAERRVVAGDAEGELVHVGLAEHDRARADQRLGDRRVARGHERLEPGRPRRVRHPGHMDVVLHHDGHPVERSREALAGGQPVGPARGRERVPGLEGGEGVEIAPPLGHIHEGPHEVLAPERPRPDAGGRLGGRQLGQLLRSRPAGHADHGHDDRSDRPPRAAPPDGVHGAILSYSVAFRLERSDSRWRERI